MSIESRIAKVERKLDTKNEVYRSSKEEFDKYCEWLNDDSDQTEILKHKEMGSIP